mmetsp:Transcript_74071/g.194291  ORF Transcript_74071/g.194291 Transcript_74071/m.194291 type:complete len:143 (-) Transcript_74071:256-684(-)
MAPKSKAIQKAIKSICKGGIAEAIASETELKEGEVTKELTVLADFAAKEVKNKFIIPVVGLIKTRQETATMAGKRVVFGKMIVVQEKPAKTVEDHQEVCAQVRVHQVQGQAQVDITRTKHLELGTEFKEGGKNECTKCKASA